MTNPHPRTHLSIATHMSAISARKSEEINTHPPPLKIFALFHKILACFCFVGFRLSSPFRDKPSQPPRRAFSYDGCHARPLRR